MDGRVPSIGLGGFASSCVTFLSRSHGFSCDNIYGYEVVLASGEIVYVTTSSYPDLGGLSDIADIADVVNTYGATIPSSANR
ncbi:Uu.00g123120.m01.CDS01 [Anthostomella pinea]|uniref:Uu.00g123120.m01.CDS01 n=1 Tax=Anthostomella pinea TaxID=933095 RepID=A0AAI8YF24_9PEZI|nr:Uu.00g123120.m01.CDS01 [Anthostomella pinea]